MVDNEILLHVQDVMEAVQTHTTARLSIESRLDRDLLTLRVDGKIKHLATADGMVNYLLGLSYGLGLARKGF